MKENGKTYYYITDRLGNVRYVTESSGSVVQSYLYSPFGKIHTSSGSLTQPYQYVGEHYYYTEEDTGLKLLGQRWYDSGVGRFISRDPIECIFVLKIKKQFEISLSLSKFFSLISTSWKYVENNPISYIDPYGEISPWWFLGILWYLEIRLGWKIGQKFANTCLSLPPGESKIIKLIPTELGLFGGRGIGLKITKEKCGKCRYRIVYIKPII